MLKGFYFITDRRLSRKGLLKDVREAVKSGVCAVQYRDKNVDVRLMAEMACILRGVCRDVPLIINDRIDIALACRADGVHLGQDDMPVNIARRILGKGKIIGVTVHSFLQARKAVMSGADYLGIAPVFLTTTKDRAGRPVGLSFVSKIRKAFKGVTIVAIGGIKLKDAREVINAGADALCAISAVAGKENCAEEIRKFVKEINSGLAFRGML